MLASTQRREDDGEIVRLSVGWTFRDRLRVVFMQHPLLIGHKKYDKPAARKGKVQVHSMDGREGMPITPAAGNGLWAFLTSVLLGCCSRGGVGPACITTQARPHR